MRALLKSLRSSRRPHLHLRLHLCRVSRLRLGLSPRKRSYHPRPPDSLKRHLFLATQSMGLQCSQQQKTLNPIPAVASEWLLRLLHRFPLLIREQALTQLLAGSIYLPLRLFRYPQPLLLIQPLILMSSLRLTLRSILTTEVLGLQARAV